MAAVLSFDNEHAGGARPRQKRTIAVEAAAVHQAQGARSRRLGRKARQERWELLSFLLAAISALGFFAANAVQSLSRSAAAAARPALAAITVPVTVHRGDTLWAYAQKYEAANTYILDRVETIAATNDLSPQTALVPGEHLRVPVTNPVLLARLERSHRLASAKR